MRKISYELNITSTLKKLTDRIMNYCGRIPLAFRQGRNTALLLRNYSHPLCEASDNNEH